MASNLKAWLRVILRCDEKFLLHLIEYYASEVLLIHSLYDEVQWWIPLKENLPVFYCVGCRYPLSIQQTQAKENVWCPGCQKTHRWGTPKLWNEKKQSCIHAPQVWTKLRSLQDVVAYLARVGTRETECRDCLKQVISSPSELFSVSEERGICAACAESARKYNDWKTSRYILIQQQTFK